MNYETHIFTRVNAARMTAFKARSQQAAMMIPVYLTGVVLFGLLCLGIFAMEYGLGYGLFADLLGEDEGYFSPETLALSTIIAVLAIHFLAHGTKGSRIVRVINAIAAKMVLVYAIGLGLTFASLLFVYLLDLLPAPEIDLLLDAPLEQSQHWVEIFMGEYASPLAVLLLSAGIGALIIINIFVAHHAISHAVAYFAESQKRSKALKADLADYQTYIRAQKQCARLQAELEREITKDHEQLKEMVIEDFLNALDTPLRKAEISLNQLQLGTQTFPGDEPPINSKILEKRVSALRAITADTLKQHIN